MRSALQVGDAVAADHHQRVAEVRLDVGLVDDEVDADRPVALRGGEDPPDDVFYRRRLVGGDVDEHLPLVLGERRAAGEADDLGEGNADVVEVEVLDHPAAAGGVGVHVQGDIGAFGVRPVDEGETVVDQSPVRLARRLVVRDVHEAPAAAPDGDGLLDGLEEAVPLVAHVGRVDATRFTGRPGQLDHLVGLRPPAGHVDQAGREAACTFLHGPLDVPAHGGELLGGGVSLLVAEHRLAHRVVADEGDGVGRRLPLVNGLAVALDAGPVAAQAAEEPVARLLSGRVGDGAEAAVADHQARAPLRHLELQAGVGEEGAVVVGVGVDEAGGERRGRSRRARWCRGRCR